MEYWPVLILLLYTAWLCEYPLPVEVEGEKKISRSFFIEARYWLLGKWFLFLVFGLMTIYINPVFFFIAFIFFALFGWQMQCAFWERKLHDLHSHNQAKQHQPYGLGQLFRGFAAPNCRCWQALRL